MYGSLQNRLMESSKQVEPEIGMGATLTFWSDREAATVVDIERFKTGARKAQVKAITVQVDDSRLIKGSIFSESQHYEHYRNIDGTTYRFIVGKNGQYKGPSGGLLLGHRLAYRDPHF